MDVQHVPEDLDVQIDKMNVRICSSPFAAKFRIVLKPSLNSATVSHTQFTVFANGQCIDYQIGDVFTCEIDSIMADRYCTNKNNNK